MSLAGCTTAGNPHLFTSFAVNCNRIYIFICNCSLSNVFKIPALIKVENRHDSYLQMLK